MKVIDLLNKIANEEGVPERIKIAMSEPEIFRFDVDENQYYNENEDKPSLLEYMSLHNVWVWLNLDIQPISKIGKINTECYWDVSSLNDEEWSNSEIILVTKINEIIDKINEMENK